MREVRPGTSEQLLDRDQVEVVRNEVTQSIESGGTLGGERDVGCHHEPSATRVGDLGQVAAAERVVLEHTVEWLREQRWL